MMKNRFFFLLVFCTVILAACPAFGETVRENPSFYSFAEIAQKVPAMWLSKPADVLALMENYPDYTCRRSYDLIGCQSVNNQHSAEIHLNFTFSSSEDNAELSQMVFSMETNTPEDVQNVIEKCWLPDMKPANIMGGFYRPKEIKLYFRTEETLMTVMFPWSMDGKVSMIMVDMGLIRG